MSILADIFTGQKIEVPKVIKDTFVDGERALYAIQQARLKQVITPDSIFVTNKRVIIHKPRLLGLKRNIEDYKYTDMSNTVIDQGIISSTIAIKVRFLSDNLMLESIPNGIARGIFRTIQEGIAGNLEPKPASPMQAALVPVPITKETLDRSEDLMDILKRRYATGEITKRQYNAMKADLVPGKPKRRRKKKE
jgi:hypothetical protein